MNAALDRRFGRIERLPPIGTYSNQSGAVTRDKEVTYSYATEIHLDHWTGWFP